MRTRRLLSALAMLALLSAAAAAPAEAKTKPKYRFKFATTLHAQWEWPVNPNNRDRRDSMAFEVLGGSGCGTSPAKARWKITDQIPDSGLPVQSLIIDFAHNPTQKNPAKVVDSNYGGEPTADVQVYLRFSRTGTRKVTMTATPHGDVANLAITPDTASISRKRVKKC